MRHLDLSHTITLPGPVDAIFPLFTPLGEKDWVPGWDPEFLHPEDGGTARGMVFRTRHGGEETLWTCADWEPERRYVRYIRVTPASRFGAVAVTCEAAGPDATRATIGYTYTALTPAGEAALDAMDAVSFTAMIDRWRDLIADYRARGTA